MGAVKGQLGFLTQNTQLVPRMMKLIGQSQCPRQRISGIIYLLVERRVYDIVGLQEVWDGYGQDTIVKAWLYELGLKTPILKLQVKKEVPIKDILSHKKEVTTKTFKNDRNEEIGRIIDARPNSLKAQIVYDRHFVMGPDTDKAPLDIHIIDILLSSVFKNLPEWVKKHIDIEALKKKIGIEIQDGGLLILTMGGCPIIAASGFVYCCSTYLDALSNKGALYARIEVGDDYIHVFNTHLQAHGFPDVRKHQLEELKTFIENATSDKKGQYDGHPVVLLGDFNIVGGSSEYNTTLRQFLKSLNLVDAWYMMNPKSPGYTWSGKGQNKDPNGPWWILGNVLAGESGGQQRLDYFFYKEGSSKVIPNPKSVSLLPPGPQTLYYFVPEWEKWWKSEKVSNLRKAPILKGEIKPNGIYGLHITGNKLMQQSPDQWDGTQWVGNAGDRIARVGKYTIYVPGPIPSAIVIAKIKRIHKTYASAELLEVKPLPISSIPFFSHTVSDHLGVEMTCGLVPRSRIRRIEVQIDKNGKITVKPNPAAISNGFHVEWHVEADKWGAKGFELKLPKHKNSPFGNVNEDILKWIEEPQPCKSVIHGPIEWPKGVKKYPYAVRFSKSPKQVSVTATLIGPSESRDSDWADPEWSGSEWRIESADWPTGSD
ncbi:MAG: endonuclease/exonuclease/phosphatase family protein [Chloroflexota bacterium]|nr:endonuclease/exonuclease/phosphatase family protein [Chloroflexota bacterium]